MFVTRVWSPVSAGAKSASPIIGRDISLLLPFTMHWHGSQSLVVSRALSGQLEARYWPQTFIFVNPLVCDAGVVTCLTLWSCNGDT